MTELRPEFPAVEPRPGMAASLPAREPDAPNSAPPIRSATPNTPHAAPPLPAAPQRSARSVVGRTRLTRLLRGNPSDPAWSRPALLGLLLLAAVVDTWNLARVGWGNSYYAAAALAGSKDWTAFFFGSIDASNFITVDKPPLSLWVMALSGRIFGVGTLSFLLPQAIEGVLAVAVLYDAVRRVSGRVAGLIAGLVLTLTPVAALMFRYDNPDALLTLLEVGAAWTMLRAIRSGSTRWAVASAVLVGLAFNTKYLAAALVVPPLFAAFALAAPGSWMRRARQLVAAGVTLAVASGWWVLLVQLVPAASRPYIGGSADNSVLSVALGYDGLDRLIGASPFPGGGGVVGRGGFGFAGAPDLLRLFNDQFAGQVSWLIPLAAAALVGGLALTARRPRTDPVRASYVLWGLWMIVQGGVFSMMSGIVHPYYTVALAPGIAALVGAGAVDLLALRRRTPFGGLLFATGVAATALWGWSLLERSGGTGASLAVPVLGLGLAAALVLGLPALPSLPSLGRLPAVLPGAAASLALVALMIGPAVFTADTLASTPNGGNPTAGPSLAGQGSRAGDGRTAFAFPGRGNASFPGGLAGLGGFAPPGLNAAGPGGFVPGSGAPFAGGPGDGGRGVDRALLRYLIANRGSARWIVAVASANEAAPIELATGEPVMAMGGFSGGDPAPTADQLAAYVTSGQLRFVLGGFGGFGRDGSGNRIAWVQQSCRQVDPSAWGGTAGTLYDCSAAPGS